MDGWTLGLLVDYIYTAEIQVTEDNVQVNTYKHLLSLTLSQQLWTVITLSRLSQHLQSHAAQRNHSQISS